MSLTTEMKTENEFVEEQVCDEDIYPLNFHFMMHEADLHTFLASRAAGRDLGNEERDRWFNGPHGYETARYGRGALCKFLCKNRGKCGGSVDAEELSSSDMPGLERMLVKIIRFIETHPDMMQRFSDYLEIKKEHPYLFEREEAILLQRTPA